MELEKEKGIEKNIEGEKIKEQIKVPDLNIEKSKENEENIIKQKEEILNRLEGNERKTTISEDSTKTPKSFEESKTEDYLISIVEKDGPEAAIRTAEKLGFYYLDFIHDWLSKNK